MRRKDREITDRAEIEAIIAKAQVCRLAMVDEDLPYIGKPVAAGTSQREKEVKRNPQEKQTGMF